MPDEKTHPIGVSEAELGKIGEPADLRERNRRQAMALVAALTPEELTLLRQITAGWSKADSAKDAGMAMHQIEKRRAGLFAKINAGSTTEAVRIGIYADL